MYVYTCIYNYIYTYVNGRYLKFFPVPDMDPDFSLGRGVASESTIGN